MDENVHFSLSMKVANELIKENKDFDMLIVPNTDHSGVCIALLNVMVLPEPWLGQMIPAYKNMLLVCPACVRRARPIRSPSHVGLLRDTSTRRDTTKGVRDQRRGRAGSDPLTKEPAR